MKKHLLGAILLIAVLTVPLSAQSGDNAKIFVSSAKGGNRSARAYFNSKLPEAARLLGYELVDKKKDSDFYLTVVLKKDKGVNIVAVALHYTKTKKQVAVDAMGYAVPTDIDDWNRYLINELLMGAGITPSSTAGEIAVSEAAVEGSETRPTPEYPLHWLYLGARGGYSMRFYTPPGENFAFNFDTGYDLGHTFEAGIRAAGQVLPWLSLQAEGIFTMDTAFDKANTAEYKSLSLMFPLVAKVTFRPGQWLIAPFGGAYISVPLGKMDRSISDSEYESDWGWDNWMGLGWTAGLEVGRRLGPGTLFLDVRYSADFGDTFYTSPTDYDIMVYRRTAATVSLGYDFGLLQKRK